MLESFRPIFDKAKKKVIPIVLSAGMAACGGSADKPSQQDISKALGRCAIGYEDLLSSDTKLVPIYNDKGEIVSTVLDHYRDGVGFVKTVSCDDLDVFPQYWNPEAVADIIRGTAVLHCGEPEQVTSHDVIVDARSSHIEGISYTCGSDE